MAVWRNIVDCANINLVGHLVNESLLEMLSVLEAQVAAVNIIRQGEAKLALVEVSRVRAVVETHQ